MEKLIEELKTRILALESEKEKLEEIRAWRANEEPKTRKELDGLRAELHELRGALDRMLKGPAAGPTEPKAEEGWLLDALLP